MSISYLTRITYYSTQKKQSKSRDDNNSAYDFIILYGTSNSDKLETLSWM